MLRVVSSPSLRRLSPLRSAFPSFRPLSSSTPKAPSAHPLAKTLINHVYPPLTDDLSKEELDTRKVRDERGSRGDANAAS